MKKYKVWLEKVEYAVIETTACTVFDSEFEALNYLLDSYNAVGTMGYVGDAASEKVYFTLERTSYGWDFTAGRGLI